MVDGDAARTRARDTAVRVAALLERLARSHPDAALVETHISWVLLAGRLAYKIKKPVRFGFLDFSTLEARHRFCVEEVRLNRRLAPALYLGVVPLRGGAAGLALGGRGPVVDYAVKMRRFPAGALAGTRLAQGELGADELARFALRLARFHADAPAATPDSGFGGGARVRADALHAVDALREHSDPVACARLRAWFEAQSRELAPVWDERRRAGRVREGHGDLHLDNVLVLGDEVTAFDCIEFDPALRWIDVANDAAYLVMDLIAHGRSDLGFGFLDRYLEETGDHGLVAVLRHALVYRAVVRALVAALRRRGDRSGRAGAPGPDYLALAAQLSAGARPRLLVTHGLPGTGKTRLTQALLGQAGAIRVRSDVERKRLAGLAPLEASRGVVDLYTRSANEATYARLGELAETSLRAGWPTIVDAAFLRRAERQRMRALAQGLGVPFTILACEAPEPVLRQRLRERAARGGDASEADEAVLDTLLARQEPLGDDEAACAIRVRTDEEVPARELAARWLALGHRAAPG